MKRNLFVFDTNVLLSALFDDKSVPAMALKKARAKGILLISDDVADEYTEVFSRKKFDKYVPLIYRLAFIENIIANSFPVTVNIPIIASRDTKDDKFLSLATSGGAGCIVSGDTDLLALHPFHSIPILSPSDFLNNF